MLTLAFATMLAGCAIALAPIGLVMLGLAVLGIVGAMRRYQRRMLAIRYGSSCLCRSTAARSGRAVVVECI